MLTANPSHVIGLGQIAFAVDDVVSSTRFFKDKLRLPFLFNAAPGLAFFDLGGIRLMLCRPQGAGRAGSNSILYLKVDDIREAYVDLAGRGVRFEREPSLVARLPEHELWMAFFRDPEGNLLALTEERA
jgi:catechol 2,3-dioxygenase-like lactoylglutathione lyase family enzyme